MVALEKDIAFSQEHSPFEGISGVGAIVLNSRHEILVGVENKSKSSSERTAGQLSIPLETLKPFEQRGNRRALQLASLSEIATDKYVDDWRRQLEQVQEDLVVTMNNAGVKAAIFVYHWTGDPDVMPFESSCSEEFGSLRWLSLENIYKTGQVRPFADVALREASTQGLLNGHNSVPLGFKNYVPSRYSNFRELHADVAIVTSSQNRG